MLETIFKKLYRRYSNYKTLFPLIIISGATLLMLAAGTSSSISSNYQYVYAAAKNKTNTATDESTSDTTTTTKNTPSPIGSKTFMTVTTKVSGGTSKPSDFTVTVSGKSPSPKSFSGSSSGTSVTLNAGKYKVTASGPTGYTTGYSSGCSGTASGGTPVKCTIKASFSLPTPSPSGSNNTSSPTSRKNSNGMLLRLIVVDKANCHIRQCPALHDAYITVYNEGKTIARYDGDRGNLKNINDIYSVNKGDKYTITAGARAAQITDQFPWKYQETRILRPAYTHQLCGVGTEAKCSGEIQVTNGPPDGTWLEIDVYHACVKLSRLYDC